MHSLSCPVTPKSHPPAELWAPGYKGVSTLVSVGSQVKRINETSTCEGHEHPWKDLYFGHSVSGNPQTHNVPSLPKMAWKGSYSFPEVGVYLCKHHFVGCLRWACDRTDKLLRTLIQLLDEDFQSMLLSGTTGQRFCPQHMGWLTLSGRPAPHQTTVSILISNSLSLSLQWSTCLHFSPVEL